MTKLENLKTVLPHPAQLHQEVQEYHENRYDLSYDYTYTEASHQSPFDVLTISNGGGDEGYIFFYKENDEVIASLITVYYNEGTRNLTPSIDVTDGSEQRQPAFQGLPFVFDKAVNADSPVLWNWESYPATCKHVFASGAIWNTGGGWETPDYSQVVGFENEPIDGDRIASDIYLMLKELPFASQ